MGLFDFFKKKTVDTEEKPQNYNQNASTPYANVRFLNWYEKGMHSAYPVWMEVECGIVNAPLKEKEMIEAGYLYHSGEFKGVTDCKLTDSGKAFVADNTEILIANSYRKYDITMDDYYNEKRLNPILSPREILWSILNKRADIYERNKQFSFLRNVYLAMAMDCEKNKEYEECLQYYIIVQFFDVSGLENGGISREHIFVAPAIKKAIHKYSEHYNPEMIKSVEALNLPMSLTSIKTFKTLISKMLNGEELPKKYNP